MASRTEWRLTVALVLLAAFFALLLPSSGSREAYDPRASSFRATPNGVLALYLLLEELGISAERRTTRFTPGEPLDGTIALFAPTLPLAPTEVDALLAWVEEGGKLMYVAAPDDTLLTALGLVVERVHADSAAVTGAATASPAEEHALTAGVERVYAFQYAFADSSAGLSGDALPLLRIDTRHTGAVLLRRGSGLVLAWSDAGPLANHSLQTSGAALVFARAAREFTGGDATVQFDEYHHGFQGGGSPVQAMTGFLFESRAGRIFLQMALAGLALLILVGSRFGAPRLPEPARRRSPLEHLHALAGAYRAGNARNRARHLVLAGVARRLGRRPPASGEELEFLTRLASQAPQSPSSAMAFLEEWRKGEGADLTTLAHQADRLVMETKGS